MLHHGGSSSKRSIFWGNLSAMNELDKGKLSHAERSAKTTVKTTRTVATLRPPLKVSWYLFKMNTIKFQYISRWVPGYPCKIVLLCAKRLKVLVMMPYALQHCSSNYIRLHAGWHRPQEVILTNRGVADLLAKRMSSRVHRPWATVIRMHIVVCTWGQWCVPTVRNISSF